MTKSNTPVEATVTNRITRNTAELKLVKTVEGGSIHRSRLDT
ncbi:MAG: hypothetical protein V9G10_17175 [Candidatus Nanopelagicales bacterium]